MAKFKLSDFEVHNMMNNFGENLLDWTCTKKDMRFEKLTFS